MVMRNEETYTIHIEGPDLQALHMQYPDKTYVFNYMSSEIETGRKWKTNINITLKENLLPEEHTDWQW
jgi:hypothetical protein